MIKRIKRPVSILLAVLTAASLLAVTIVTAGATCFPISSNAVVNYSADNTRIESIDIDFAYFDDGIWPAIAADRYYNMIFTTDARFCTMSTAYHGGGSWELIAGNIGSTAIYSVNDELDSSSIDYDFRNNGAGADISGSYTIDDAEIFSRFERGKTYYGLLCSRLQNGSAKGVWYTGTYATMHIHNWSFSLEDDHTIKATCICDSSGICTETGKSYTLKLNDAAAEYTGSAVKSTTDGLETFKKATCLNVSEDDIVYYLEDGTTQTNAENSGAEGNGKAPVKAGTYKAKLSVAGVTATSTVTIASEKKLIVGQSLALEGNIKVNFFIDPSAAHLTPADVAATPKTLTVDFSWADYVPISKVSDFSTTVKVDSSNYKNVGDLIPVSCKVCAAEMSCGIKIDAELNGKAETKTYCVRDYGVTTLDRTSVFSVKYAGEYGAKKYADLCDLVKKMLDYGAKAQKVFNIKTTDLANNILVGENAYSMDENVDGDTFDDAIEAANPGQTASDMNAVAESIGAKWYTTSLIYLSDSTLRHYFTKTETGDALNASQYDGNKSDYYYYKQKDNIAAAKLDDLQTFEIGGVTFKYSALDYAKAVVEDAKSTADRKALAKSLYWYNKAANVFFD